MHNFWPAKIKASTSNTFLWQHEWETHGKDYAKIIYKLKPEAFPGTTSQRNAALQLAYFRDTINFYKSLKVKKLPRAGFSKAEYAAQIEVSAENLIFSCFKASWVR